jgi:hypothetical protein
MNKESLIIRLGILKDREWKLSVLQNDNSTHPKFNRCNRLLIQTTNKIKKIHRILGW